MKMRHRSHDGESLRIATPAKVNLFFELLGKREDGFHEIETVMSTVSLFDDLCFVARDDGQLKLTVQQEGCTAREEIPTDERNLVLRAMSNLRDAFGKPFMGCDVVLRKRIPSAAGLGGASGNAAGALVAANRLWQLELDTTRLQAAAAQLGSDIPFFLSGGTARCTGRGEIIESQEVPAGMALVVVKPEQGLSTASVYRQCVVPANPANPADLMECLKLGDWRGVGRSLFNRLESFAMPMTPAIGKLKQMFDRLDCVGHQMSGSGSSYFGIFRNAADAHRAAKIATTDIGNTVFACATLGPEHAFPEQLDAG